MKWEYGTKPSALLNWIHKKVTFLKRKSDYVQKSISKQSLESPWKKIFELGKAGMVFNP